MTCVLGVVEFDSVPPFALLKFDSGGSDKHTTLMSRDDLSRRISPANTDRAKNRRKLPRSPRIGESEPAVGTI
jgi:hypothetical protein